MSNGSDMEHFTENQMTKLLDAMEQRENDLRAQVSSERERAMEMYTQLDGVAGDEADQALTKIRAGIENELIDRHVRELAAPEAARGRVAEGTYGVCVECGEPIGFGRLNAYPAALRCANCQTQHEKTFAGTPFAVALTRARGENAA